MRGLSEQLIVQYCALTESIANKQLVSSAQSTERDERDKRRLKEYDNLLAFVFEQNSIEVVNAIRTLVESMKKNLSERTDE